MSIRDEDIVDGIGINEDENAIVLLISDPLDWKDEYTHLKMLQTKINSYITFWEEKQYKDIYKDMEFDYGVIEIHFSMDIPENCIKFLQVVQDQVGELGLMIKAIIVN